MGSLAYDTAWRNREYFRNYARCSYPNFSPLAISQLRRYASLICVWNNHYIHNIDKALAYLRVKQIWRTCNYSVCLHSTHRTALNLIMAAACEQHIYNILISFIHSLIHSLQLCVPTSQAAARIAGKSVEWLIRFNACITFHSSKTHSEYNRTPPHI